MKKADSKNSLTARGIDFSADDTIDERARKDLVRAAVTYNTSGGKGK